MTDTDASGSLGGQQPVVDPLNNNYLHGVSASLAGWMRRTFYLSEPIAKRISEANKTAANPVGSGRLTTATAKYETHGQEPAGYKACNIFMHKGQIGFK